MLGILPKTLQLSTRFTTVPPYPKGHDEDMVCTQRPVANLISSSETTGRKGGLDIPKFKYTLEYQSESRRVRDGMAGFVVQKAVISMTFFKISPLASIDKKNKIKMKWRLTAVESPVLSF